MFSDLVDKLETGAKAAGLYLTGSAITTIGQSITGEGNKLQQRAVATAGGSDINTGLLLIAVIAMVIFLD